MKQESRTVIDYFDTLKWLPFGRKERQMFYLSNAVLQKVLADTNAHGFFTEEKEERHRMPFTLGDGEPVLLGASTHEDRVVALKAADETFEAHVRITAREEQYDAGIVITGSLDPLQRMVSKGCVRLHQPIPHKWPLWRFTNVMTDGQHFDYNYYKYNEGRIDGNLFGASKEGLEFLQKILAAEVDGEATRKLYEEEEEAARIAKHNSSNRLWWLADRLNEETFTERVVARLTSRNAQDEIAEISI